MKNNEVQFRRNVQNGIFLIMVKGSLGHFQLSSKTAFQRTLNSVQTSHLQYRKNIQQRVTYF